MMQAITGVHAHVRDLHGDLRRAAAAETGEGLSDMVAEPAGMPARGRRSGASARGRARTTRSSSGRPRASAGRPALPGDKSISHRALLLALLAEGESRIDAAGDGADVRSTAGIVAALGATVERVAERAGRVDYRVVSPGGDALLEPDGDPRLRQLRDHDAAGRRAAGRAAAVRGARRGRVAPAPADGPRRGAARGDGRGVRRPPRIATLLPLASPVASRLAAIDYATPVPSAQVKSAILLAALAADGETTVTEAVATRDHTERMLRARGVAVSEATAADGRHMVRLAGPAGVRALDETVPADPSGAAFWLVAGAIHPDAELHLDGVSTNPTRRAIIDILRRMGADIEEHDRPAPGGQDGEPLADLVVRSSDASGDRPVPRRRGGGHRRDPDPRPGRDRRDGHDADPGRRRAPSQGVGPDRRDRGRAHGPGRAGCASRATTSRSTVASRLRGAVTETL